MIPQETVQKILDECRVEEVIGDFRELKREGSNFKCLSPFTDERTASCLISPVKNIWKDFSSGKGGTSLSYLMQAEKMTFPEAMKHLGKKYNIEIVEKKYSAKEKHALAEYNLMYEANAYAQEFFNSELFSTDSKGLDYFKGRGYSDEIIKAFKLGYCDGEFSSFTNTAMSSGYKEESLSSVGLTISNGRRPFDAFKGRVMFPIHDLYSKVIGFGGRILDDSDKKQPKYRNSSESRVFNKSKVLFGLNLAKENIIKKNNAYVSEGYTDVISVYSKGVENVVASCGTALTEDQLKLLSRFTDTVTILFDGDNAGVKATFKAIDLAIQVGLNPRVVKLPKEHDPDSISKIVDDLEDYLKLKSMDFVEYKCSFISKEILSDPNKKAKAIDSIVETIILITDNIERELFTKKLSALLDLSKESINSNIENKLFKNSKRLVVNKDSSLKESIKASTPEERLLSTVKMYGNRTLTFIKRNGVTETYTSTVSNEIVERLIYLNADSFLNLDLCLKIANCDYGEDTDITDEVLRDSIRLTLVEVERKILVEKIDNYDSEDMAMLQDLILRRNRINNLI